VSASNDLVLDRNLVISAGAGSGKTHALVTLALGLFAGAGREVAVDPGRAWIVTFTEKAASELRQRIRERVAALVERPPSAEFEPELYAALGGRAAPPARHWRTVSSALPAAPIGTFHSLAARTLRAYAYALRLPVDFEVMDERTSASALESAVDEVMLADLESGERDRATRTLVHLLGDRHRVRRAVLDSSRRLANEGVAPQDLDLGTPRPTAQADLASACQRLSAALEVLAATRVDRLATASRVLTWEREQIGACDPGRIAQWFPAVRRVMDAPRGRGGWSKAMRAVVGPLRAAWEDVQAGAAAEREAEAIPALVDLMNRVHGLHAADKRRAGALDFADLMHRLRDSLRDDLELRARVRTGIDVILVDEFQDTNRVQLELLRLLAEERSQVRPVSPGAGGGALALPLEPASLAAVGDRKQSIYEFRGAEVGAFTRLLQEAESDSTWRLAVLGRSWRATPPLVSFFNACFGATFGAGDDVDPWVVRWREDDSQTPVRQVDRTQGGAVTWLRPADDDDAAAWDAENAAGDPERVAAWVADGIAAGQVEPGEVAVLVRTNARLSAFAQALTRVGVPSVVLGGRGLLAAPEVGDALAAMAVVADPSDASASAAMWGSIVVGLDDDALVHLASAERSTLAQVLEYGPPPTLAPANRERIAEVCARARVLEPLVHTQSPAEVFDAVVEVFGIEAAWAERGPAAQRRANLRRVRELLAERSWRSVASAAAALRSRGRFDDHEAPARLPRLPPGAVRLMTIHSAKGLEFPVVVVPDLGRDADESVPTVVYERGLGLSLATLDAQGHGVRSPAGQRIVDRLRARRRAESWRLLYVAFTRARDRLVLCGEAPARADAHNWARHLRSLGTVLDAHVRDVSVSSWIPDRGSPGETADEADVVSEADDSGGRPMQQLSLFDRPVSRPPRRAAVETASEDQGPRLLTIGVTALQSFERCPRRYWFERVIGLPVEIEEVSSDGEGASAGPRRTIPRSDAASRALRRLGERIHAAQELVDLSREDIAAAVEEVAQRAGVDDPRDVESLQAFWAVGHGAVIRAAHHQDPLRVHRELLVAATLADGAVMLRGQLDALVVAEDGGVEVLDYKHSRRRGAVRYAFQLLTYATLVERVFVDAARIQAFVCWLGGEPASDAIDTGPRVRQQHWERLDRLARALHGASRSQLDPHAWPKRERDETCGACPHRMRCW
jgi:ATP-dependent exoDNAse (exonuclease V) beta subunit